jgi:hypothetical protein
LEHCYYQGTPKQRERERKDRKIFEIIKRKGRSKKRDKKKVGRE